MPRFVFPLQPVLGHRERLESEQQVVFAAALQRVADAERIRDRFIKRRGELRERLHDHHAEMDIEELRLTYVHCEYLDRAILGQQSLVDAARREAEAERQKLVERTRDKKILETLKERRREAFAAEATAAEQREADDINARRFERFRAAQGSPT